MDQNAEVIFRPALKQQLAVHYNNRQLSAFGKLVTALNKFFDVEFAIKPILSGDEGIACKPFFAEPDWIRLPSIDDRCLIMGGREGPSLFALPPEKYRQLSAEATTGVMPYLRLSLPNVTDMKTYIEGFKNCRDWERYVVPALSSLGKGDNFPTIDHVIHTILERPPGFFCSKDSRYLFFYVLSESGDNTLSRITAQVNLKESESGLRMALANDEKINGIHHPTVARDLNRLSMFLRKAGRGMEAVPMMLRAIVILDRYGKSAGEQHPDMDSTIGDYRELAAEIGWSEMQAVIELSKALHTP